MGLMLFQMLECRHRLYLEWDTPLPTCGPEGNELVGHTTTRATVHDCVNMARRAAIEAAKGRPVKEDDMSLLADFMAVHWARPCMLPGEELRVYLCGGIAGLSDDECRGWRQRAKDMLSPICVTLDPMRRDYRGREASRFKEVVEGDLSDIGRSDAVLANVCRPSWGTAMEIVIAKRGGTPVVAFGAGDNPSPWLLYHAAQLAPGLPQACAAIVRMALDPYARPTT